MDLTNFLKTFCGTRRLVHGVGKGGSSLAARDSTAGIQTLRFLQKTSRLTRPLINRWFSACFKFSSYVLLSFCVKFHREQILILQGAIAMKSFLELAMLAAKPWDWYFCNVMCCSLGIWSVDNSDKCVVVDITTGPESIGRRLLAGNSGDI